MSIPRIVREARRPMFVAILVLSIIARSHADDGNIEDTKLDSEVSATSTRQFTGRQVFDYRRNGIRVDVKVVPSSNNDSVMNDGFPKFPTKDIGLCIIDFSLSCAKNRLGRFLESVRDLNEIHLMGQQIKLVKTRVINSPRSINESNETIQRSIDDMFDTFALRITLPRWNGKREKNQIDVMMDETALVEGRGKGGGGGGGGKKGSKGGGGCKMMIMAGLMMLKMKIMSVATLKGMMMAGMSLMVSMAMLMQKYMKGGGGYGGGGGGQYKEIVLLTKSTGGSSQDSYGAPPPSTSYGQPSSYGGGGWGRSFGRRFITSDLSSTIDSKNSSDSDQPSNLIAYEPANSDLNFTYPNWKYLRVDSVKNRNDMEPLLRQENDDYSIEVHPYQDEKSKDYVTDSGEMISYGDSLDASTKSNYIANEASNSYPVYDEWHSTREQISQPSTSSTT